MPQPMGARRGTRSTLASALILGLAATSLWAAPSALLPAAPQARLVADPALATFGSVELIGLDPATLDRLRRTPDELADFLRIYTGEASPQDGRPAVLGSYTVELDRVRFTPRYPFDPGRSYVALWQDPASGADTTTTFALPPPELEATTEVVAVYPSSNVLPENVLKIYLWFSAPMSRGEAPHRLRLVTADGEPVPFPFVAPELELWNPSTDRLTLFFDPGRIKRGVGPNESLGPPLKRGKTYRLIVEQDFRDARGQPLRAAYEKRFKVVAPDRNVPSIDAWRLTPPASPEARLVVDFPEPLDQALLSRLLAVIGPGGERLSGEITIENDETRWTFKPATPWRAGAHELRVATLLEDIAGNSLRRPFETVIDVTTSAVGPLSSSLPFTVELSP